METSKVYPLVYSALDYRALRQDLIAGNIANVDTPYYKPRDISFESMLAQEQRQLYKEPSQILKLAITNKRDIQAIDDNKQSAEIFFRDGHLARNDGNSVDLDVESSELSKNATMYQALLAALKRHKGIFTYAIESSRNLG